MKTNLHVYLFACLLIFLSGMGCHGGGEAITTKYVKDRRDRNFTMQHAVLLPPNKLFYKLANQDTRI